MYGWVRFASIATGNFFSVSLGERMIKKYTDSTYGICENVYGQFVSKWASLTRGYIHYTRQLPRFDTFHKKIRALTLPITEKIHYESILALYRYTTFIAVREKATWKSKIQVCSGKDES